MNRDELPQMAAAGGLVLSGGHALLIRKHHLWDLPKGKLNGDESPEHCAVREIAEETGLNPLPSFHQGAPSVDPATSPITPLAPVNKTVDWFPPRL